MLFATTASVSAALLFLLQPLSARMLLPLFGGSTAVWVVALVFYQAILLAAYGYAHLTTSWLGVGRQAIVHAVLLALSLLWLPTAVPVDAAPPSGNDVSARMLTMLLAMVGVPLFAVSASTPLLHTWLLGTGYSDPARAYALYAASNAGSILALVGYPFLIEPHLGVEAQSRWWARGYGALSVLIVACMVCLWYGARRQRLSRQRTPSPETSDGALAERQRGREPSGSARWLQRGRWMVLALAPSSMLVGATTHLSNEIAPAPMLWVLPLATYLVTFVLAFAGRRPPALGVTMRAFPFVVLALALALASRASEPVAVLVPLHLGALFVASLVCHVKLADDRPESTRLSEFYLCLTLGGVLGGAFSALVAPLLLKTGGEYPLALFVTCLVGYYPPRREGGVTQAIGRRRPRLLDVGLPLALGLLTAGLIIRRQSGSAISDPVAAAALFGPPLLICLTFLARPLRFSFGVGAFLLATALTYAGQGTVILTDRSFFGIHRVKHVTLGDTQSFHVLMHGNTIHGLQSLDLLRGTEPLGYYHRTGPFGQVVSSIGIRGRPVAVVGLGTGALVCYGTSRQRWDFFEIDPAVERIARDSRFFTYLRDCPADARVTIGDGRLALARQRQAGPAYQLLVLDAYSASSIPVHLLTREAVQVYLDRL
ncbi:MAG: hypothetical protein M3442_00450, partial [Chloroflexota bacterium]|nr:hypothetical protein [Chloroflexota bacterium]